MSIIYTPHVCNTPPANRRIDPTERLPSYDKGTVWQCDTCTRYWWFEVFSGFGFWNRVRFWNLITRHRIRKAAQ